MTVVLSALRSELLSDPVGFGYSALLGPNDNGLADLLNSVVANVSHATTSTITVGTVFAVSMQQGVVASEYSSLQQNQRDMWHDIVAIAVPGLAISNTQIRLQMAFVWSAGTTTRGNLSNLQARTCARSETLFGENQFVNATQVYQARTNSF